MEKEAANRLLLNVFFLIAITITQYLVLDIVAPVISTDMIMEQIEIDDMAWSEMQTYEEFRRKSGILVVIVCVLATAVIWIPGESSRMRRYEKSQRTI